MAKFEVAFNMIGKVRDSARIEQFLEQHGIDYTIRKDENGVDHEYGFLAGGSGAVKPLTVISTEPQPYDEKHNTLPIKLTMSDNSTKVVEISPEIYANDPAIQQRGVPLTDALNAIPVPTATEDMEPHEFNTAFINDFIQFSNPYKLDPRAQEIILDILGKTLDYCEEIRVGKADIPEHTAYKLEFDKMEEGSENK